MNNILIEKIYRRKTISSSQMAQNNPSTILILKRQAYNCANHLFGYRVNCWLKKMQKHSLGRSKYHR